ncbi:MAG: hypothetical protein J6M10_10370 [Clostridia bacterium]|nr:hypothetical protein [Clostridia bacterium]
MSNNEIKRVSEIAEKTRDLPEELQRRLCDTANGMVMAAEAYKAYKAGAQFAATQTEPTRTA